MAISNTFRELVLDRLEPFAPALRTRNMFGGVGIYSGDTFFALLAFERLYVKVDDDLRSACEANGWEPFRPFGEKILGYFEIPLEVIESRDQLQPWIEKSLAVARRATQQKATKKKRVKTSRSPKTSEPTKRKKRP